MSPGKSLRRSIFPCLILTLGLLPPAAAEEVQKLGVILDRKVGFHQKTVVVAGKVQSINYAPELRNGMTMYSFVLDDSTGQVKVISPHAPMLGRGDEVRVIGTFQSTKTVLDKVTAVAEIDSSKGALEIIKSERYDSMEEKLNNPVSMTVQTSEVETPWSVTVDVASVLSAVLALVLFFNLRSFKLGLEIVEIKREIRFADGRSAFHTTLLLSSTESTDPFLSPETEVRIAGKPFFANIFHLPEGSPVDTPISINRERTIRVEYDITEEAGASQALELGFQIILSDAICKKKFRKRFGYRVPVTLGSGPEHAPEEPSSGPARIEGQTRQPTFADPQNQPAERKSEESKKKKRPSKNSANAGKSQA